MEGYCASDRPDPANISGPTPEPCHTFFLILQLCGAALALPGARNPRQGARDERSGTFDSRYPAALECWLLAPGCLAAQLKMTPPAPPHPRHLSRSRREYGTLAVNVPVPSYPLPPQP